MFEAVVALCLAAAPSVCRDSLLPGYHAQSQSECMARLMRDPPVIAPQEALTQGVPVCREAGPEADVIEAAPGVFVHMGQISDATADNAGDVSNTGFIIGSKAVAVIDTGGSVQVAEALFRAIRSRTDLPVRHVILTHMHPDHVLGTSVFARQGARAVGHAGLRRALADRAHSYLANFARLMGEEAFLGTEIVLPDDRVVATRTLDLGGRRIELRAWPNAHTSSDLTVGDATSGILFTGDLMFHRHAPALDGSVLGWQQVLSDLQDLPYSRIVPGHGGPVLDWPRAAAPLERYLEVLITETRAAIDRGESLGQAAAEIALGEAPAWELFDLFNARNATVAYTELEWE